MKYYCKTLCDNLNIEFNKRTIVVTALTGAAAVSINGETTAKACQLKSKSVEEDSAWEHTIMLIVDEISFATKEEIETLNKNLRIIRDKQRGHFFGDLHVIFAGDFFQLKPVGSKPLYLYTDFHLWENQVHTFMELRTNHRFKKDELHGKMLERYRSNMFSREDADTYNVRHLSSETNLCTEDMPDNTVVAVKDNKDRDAIHDAMFLKHLEKTHSKDPAHTPPTHTICVLASDMEWRLNHHTYVPMSSYGRDIVYATCSGNLVRTDKGSKCIDPLLKLYDGCVLMVIENIDVDNKIPTGAVGKFKELF